MTKRVLTALKFFFLADETRLKWLLILSTLLLFYMPERVGMKVDPAVYGGLAKQVWVNGWWPLGLFESFFPQFYEHPPGVVWLMALFLKLPLRDEWTVHLFSRLCGLLTLIVGIHCCRLSTPFEERWQQRAALFVFFCVSWMGWLKYVGSGQLEGPLGLLIMLTLMILLLGYSQSSNHRPMRSFRFLLGWLALGFLGFFFKGVFFLPVLAGAVLANLLWEGIRKTIPSIGLPLVGFLGWALGTALIYVLDWQTNTHFVSSYFGQQVFGTVVEGTQRGAESLSLDLGRFFRAFVSYLTLEARFNFLWSLPILLALVAFFARFRNHKYSSLSVASASLYLAFIAPIALSAFKLPHWGVPAFGVGACFLASVFPLARLPHSPNATRNLKRLTLLLAVVLATVPISSPRAGRGEEWSDHRSLFLNSPGMYDELWIVEDDESLGLWTAKCYASFYFLPFSTVTTAREADFHKQACRPRTVVAAIDSLARVRQHEWERLGWVESGSNRGQFRFFTCYEPHRP